MPQPAMLLGAMPHHNSGLFSDHYLNVTLPRREDWQALAAAARPGLDAVRRIYAAYTPSDNEAQIEKDLLEYQLRPDDSEDGWTVALLNDKGERHEGGAGARGQRARPSDGQRALPRRGHRVHRPLPRRTGRAGERGRRRGRRLC